MSKLFDISIGVLILGGAIFFAALIASSLAISLKLLAGIAIVFLGSAIYLLLVIHLAFLEAYRAILEQRSQTTSSGIDENYFARLSALDRLNADMSGGIRLRRTRNLGLLLLGIFGFWILGGWVLARYVV